MSRGVVLLFCIGIFLWWAFESNQLLEGQLCVYLVGVS